MHAQYPTPEQRRHPAYCPVYARRTPMIPYHNGQLTYRIGEPGGSVRTVRLPCVGCHRTRD